jgi:hypothetical protein
MNVLKRDYQKHYRKENRARLLEQKRAYYQENRERILTRIRQNPEIKGSYDRQYHRRNKDKNRERRRSYQRSYRSIPEKRLVHNLRNRLSKFIRRSSGRESTEVLLGCSFEEFKTFIEVQFTAGMTWENYGPYWHIDHVMPIVAFNLTDPEQIRRCFHFSNLRPLRARDNLRKSRRITDPQLRLML